MQDDMLLHAKVHDKAGHMGELQSQAIVFASAFLFLHLAPVDKMGPGDKRPVHRGCRRQWRVYWRLCSMQRHCLE